MIKTRSPISKELPLDIVGSTAFGRYPKISIEQTFNMIISDGWMVPYAGYNKVSIISNNGMTGRGIFSSTRLGKMVLVIDNGVYVVSASYNINPITNNLTANYSSSKVGTIATTTGDVFIDENDNSQIAICDKQNLYIYNYSASTFQKITLDFTPAHISFQDGYFIAPEANLPRWRLSDPNDGTSWPANPENVGAFQTKPDNVVATVRVPGKGGLLFVFGSTVTEAWFDTGAQLFPYQKNTGFNVDYGCVNAATIAANDNIVVWLGGNEKSGAVLMVSEGGNITPLTNDGIDFKIGSMTPDQVSNCYGFIFKQDGHLIYQLTFPSANFSIIYDFNTKKIFTVCDQYMNYHIAKHVVFFNNSYYFVSLVDGNLYELNTRYTTFDGAEIPRIRVCKNIAMPDRSRFIVNNLTFSIEQGDAESIQRIDFSMSKNGGETFTQAYEKILNPLGKRSNKLNFWSLGVANEFTPQFRFWSENRFVATDGLVSIYQ